MLFSIVEGTEREEVAEKKNKDETNQAKKKLDASRRGTENATAGESYSNSHRTDVNNENSDSPLQGLKRRWLSGRF